MPPRRQRPHSPSIDGSKRSGGRPKRLQRRSELQPQQPKPPPPLLPPPRRRHHIASRHPTLSRRHSQRQPGVGMVLLLPLVPPPQPPRSRWGNLARLRNCGALRISSASSAATSFRELLGSVPVVGLRSRTSARRRPRLHPRRRPRCRPHRPRHRRSSSPARAAAAPRLS